MLHCPSLLLKDIIRIKALWIFVKVRKTSAVRAQFESLILAVICPDNSHHRGEQILRVQGAVDFHFTALKIGAVVSAELPALRHLDFT